MQARHEERGFPDGSVQDVRELGETQVRQSIAKHFNRLSKLVFAEGVEPRKPFNVFALTSDNLVRDV